MTDFDFAPPGYEQAVRLLYILWRSVWFHADWSRYRKRSWSMFGDRCLSAARRSRNLSGFVATFSRSVSIIEVGVNREDRQELWTLMNLPEKEQRKILDTIRTTMPVLLLTLKNISGARWEISRLEEAEAMIAEEEEE